MGFQVPAHPNHSVILWTWRHILKNPCQSVSFFGSGCFFFFFVLWDWQPETVMFCIHLCQQWSSTYFTGTQLDTHRGNRPCAELFQFNLRDELLQRASCSHPSAQGRRQAAAEPLFLQVQIEHVYKYATRMNLKTKGQLCTCKHLADTELHVKTPSLHDTELSCKACCAQSTWRQAITFGYAAWV